MPNGEVLVGRATELATLCSFLDHLPERGRIVSITGPAGIGKTRLAEEVVAAAQDRRIPTLWGRFLTDAGAPPLEALAHLARTAQRVGLATAPDVSAALQRVLTSPPAVQRTPDASPDASSRRRYELARTLAEQFANWSGSDGLVVVLDDAQWADEDTLRALSHVGREVRTSRILLLLTYRPADVADDSELWSLCSEGEHLALPGLGTTHLRDLVESLGEPDTAAEDLHRLTGGNPFFACEVIRWRGLHGHGAGTPSSVRAVLDSQLRRLDTHGLDVLAVLAVLGRDVGADSLVRIVGEGAPPMEHTLDALVCANLLRRTDTGTVDLQHDLLRDAVRRSSTDELWARWHARICEVLEQTPLGLDLSALAFHAREAFPHVDPHRSIRLTLEAAHRAEAASALDRADAEFSAAADLAARRDQIGPGDALEATIGLGRVRAKRGRRSEAKVLLLDAADRAERTGHRSHVVEAALTMPPALDGLLASFDVDRDQLRLLERAKEIVEPGTAHAARVDAKLAAASYWMHRGRGGEQALRWSRERRELVSGATALARTLGDDSTLAYCLDASLQARWSPEDLDERGALTRELMVTAQRLPDRQASLSAHVWRGLDLIDRWNAPELEREIAVVDNLAEQSSNAFHRWTVAKYRTTHAVMVGDLERAEAFAQEVLDRGGAAGFEFEAPAAWIASVAMIRHLQGRLGELLDFLRTAVRDFELPISYSVALAFAELDAGEPDAARGRVESVFAEGLAAIAPDMTWLTTHTLLGRLCAGLDMPERARKLYELLLPHRERVVIVGGGHATYGPLDLHLGLIAPVAGFDPRPHLLRAGEIAGDSPFGRQATEALASLPSHPEASASRPRRVELARAGDHWVLRSGGDEHHMRPLIGFDYLLALIDAPKADIHVLELSARATGTRVAGGATQSVLDDVALRELRSRMEAIESDEAAAVDAGDLGRIDRLAEEREQLEAHALRHFGRSGSRNFPTDAERARSSVTKAIRSAIGRIADHDASVAVYLDATVRTGTLCRFEPVPGANIAFGSTDA